MRFQLAKVRFTTFLEQFRPLRQGRGIEWLLMRLGCGRVRRGVLQPIDGCAVRAWNQMPKVSTVNRMDDSPHT
jgi:hypothetical protein